jgi:hypothetical protein
MDLSETRLYIEHRLKTAGWCGDPAFEDDAFETIHDHAAGIPRRINALCDRLLLMGCLEKLHNFGNAEVSEVIRDIQQEFEIPITAGTSVNGDLGAVREEPLSALESMSTRIARLEDSVVSLVELLKQILALGRSDKRLPEDKP